MTEPTLEAEGLAAVIDAAEAKALTHVTLSSGVTLRVQPIPPLLMDRVINRALPVPEPPVIVVHAFDGERREPNPHDPAYRDALAELRRRRKDAMIELFLARGVEVEPPEGDVWTAELAEFGVEVGESATARRVAYLKYVLLATANDLERVLTAISRLVGVTEADIADVEARFRGVGGGPAAAGLRPDAAALGGELPA